MKRFPEALPRDVVRKIRKAKWNGASLFDIACEFDICKSTVSRYTDDIPVKARAGRPAEHDHAKVIRLLEQGLSATVIKERLGISRAHVYRICKRHSGMTPSELLAHTRHNGRTAA